MYRIKANFSNFDEYHDVAAHWELDFRLLSKNNFNAFLNMYSGLNYQLSRTRLNGKIEQFGLTPEGFRSVVIPVNYLNNFYWLNKKVSGNQLLIFPKNRTLNAVSFDGFDVFVLAIRESYLLKLIDDLGFLTARKMFSGKERYLVLSKEFSRKFHQMADIFLNKIVMINGEVNPISRLSETEYMEDIVIFLLKYIDGSSELIHKTPNRKRDKALNQAIELINDSELSISSVSELCAETKVSERTLEYAFKERFQIAPKQYIKSIRLHRVREELIRNRGSKTNISAVAGKFGFWHMGQFASDFYKQFGILPSQI